MGVSRSLHVPHSRPHWARVEPSARSTSLRDLCRGGRAGVGGRVPGASPSSLLAPTEENTYDEYENELGITAIALYDYQAGECPSPCPARKRPELPARPWLSTRSLASVCPHSGRRRDFLRPRRRHHQHRDDRRRLVARPVQGPLRPLPRQLCGAAPVAPAAAHQVPRASEMASFGVSSSSFLAPRQ